MPSASTILSWRRQDELRAAEGARRAQAEAAAELPARAPKTVEELGLPWHELNRQNQLSHSHHQRQFTYMNPREKLDAALVTGHVEGLQEALQAGSRLDDPCRALHDAARDGKLGMVAFLVEEFDGANLSDDEGFAPLHVAAINGYDSMATWLLAHGATVGALTLNGNTPLDMAVKNGQVAVEHLLIANGAQPTPQMVADANAQLDNAARTGNLADIQSALASGADEAAQSKAIATSSSLGHAESVRRLIEKDPFEFSAAAKSFDFNPEPEPQFLTAADLANQAQPAQLQVVQQPVEIDWTEMRVDPNDQNVYPRSAFYQEYGAERYMAVWERAQPTQPTPLPERDLANQAQVEQIQFGDFGEPELKLQLHPEPEPEQLELELEPVPVPVPKQAMKQHFAGAGGEEEEPEPLGRCMTCLVRRQKSDFSKSQWRKGVNTGEAFWHATNILPGLNAKCLACQASTQQVVAQPEPEPEPEPAVAIDEPVFADESFEPARLKTLAASNFKVAYDEAGPPCPLPDEFELHEIVSDIVTAHCDKEGVSRQEGTEFRDEIYDEATRDGADDSSEVSQRLWTSFTGLSDGRSSEFCFILNAAIRRDDEWLMRRVAKVCRALNRFCVTAGVTGHVAEHPPDDRCFRGGGFDMRFKDFFRIGKTFRQPAFLATSFEQEKADYFMRRSDMQHKIRWLIHIHPVRKCVHVNLIKKRVPELPDEKEYLFVPYSVFTVKSVQWRAGTNDVPHVIVLEAAPDNREQPLDLEVAPWS